MTANQWLPGGRGLGGGTGEREGLQRDMRKRCGGWGTHSLS